MSILDQIANPKMADIVGALDVRQQRLERDEAKRKEIRMGQLIAEALPNIKEGSPLYEIATTNPSGFAAFAKATGIPLNAGDRMQEFADDTEMLYTLAQNDPREAMEYAMEISEQRKEAGRDSPQMDKFIAGMREDPMRTMTGLFTVRRSLLGANQNKPAGLVEFEGMTSGLSKEDAEKARRIALGLDPRAVGSGTITTATTPGLTDAVAGSEAVITDATTRSSEDAKNATKTSKEYFDQIQNINANINNYKEGVRLLREEGASTGFVEKRLPSLRAASQKLDNLRNRLGLDVVSGTTFGALSEAELAMALDTGMPSNLQPEELAKWFEQRANAQQKMADILDGAVQYLSVPGNSLADLRNEQKKAKQGGSGEGAMTTGITQDTTEPSLDDLLSKY